MKRVAFLLSTFTLAVGLGGHLAGCERGEAPIAPSHATVDADNTARNERDADGNTKTPFDQGNSEADRTTTAKIRQGVMALDDLSMNGRNVKIITSDGRVVLRGPVASAMERERIASVAHAVAGASNVDDQLEVAAE